MPLPHPTRTVPSKPQNTLLAESDDDDTTGSETDGDAEHVPTLHAMNGRAAFGTSTGDGHRSSGEQLEKLIAKMPQFAEKWKSTPMIIDLESDEWVAVTDSPIARRRMGTSSIVDLEAPEWTGGTPRKRAGVVKLEVKREGARDGVAGKLSSQGESSMPPAKGAEEQTGQMKGLASGPPTEENQHRVSPVPSPSDDRMDPNDYTPTSWSDKNRYNPGCGTLNGFLARFPASEFVGDWLWVEHDSRGNRPTPDMDRFFGTLKASVSQYVDLYRKLGKPDAPTLENGKRITKKSVGEQCAKAVRDLAISCNHLCGKWMLFVPQSRIDDVWKRIAHAVVQGRLGPIAKVGAPNENGANNILICVYVHSFADLQDVERVLRELQDMKLAARYDKDWQEGRMRVHFKPDCYTEAGIYSKPGSEEFMPHMNIDPVLYRVADFEDTSGQSKVNDYFKPAEPGSWSGGIKAESQPSKKKADPQPSKRKSGDGEEKTPKARKKPAAAQGPPNLSSHWDF
ncbi:uncharacterized protein EV422DRAFT_535416 [Fimicolochytrium jonesii]|uniref:uncharacterized protein n=1 Tax=Fimicolochytrium jonesii TaxID=1396493 RepID=UPI0022FE6753|nr:uncharacterized protein EV422DRAFT_535416 [Fimicolochytrium jonesii]KAI8819185.1 hypothetical protein EV422DRAFT_535416 [Fimicolochytrium jonesii]